jgi:hypothetical protein
MIFLIKNLFLEYFFILIYQNYQKSILKIINLIPFQIKKFKRYISEQC